MADPALAWCVSWSIRAVGAIVRMQLAETMVTSAIPCCNYERVQAAAGLAATISS